MKRKFIIALLASYVLCIGLTGCGNEDSSSGVVPLPETTTTTTSEQSMTTTESSTSTTTAETTGATSGSESDTETESGSSFTTTTTVTTKTPTTTTSKKNTTTTIKVSDYGAIMYANCVANVRSGNSTSYDTLTTVQKNTQIIVIGICENGWYKVTVNNTVGYMSSTVLSSEKVTTTYTTTGRFEVSPYDAIMYANCDARVLTGDGHDSIMTIIPTNTQVTVTGICSNNRYRVIVNNTVGYIRTTELSPEKVTAPFHSTNDYEIAKKGNSGVYSYKNGSGYWIIDFDEGYLYSFSESSDTCSKMKFSGDLNKRVTVTFKGNYGEDTTWYIFFMHDEHPESIWVKYPIEQIDYTKTDLDDALALKNKKTIIEKE